MCSSSRSSELERKTDTVFLFPFFFLPQDLAHGHSKDTSEFSEDSHML